jgi:predicted N-acetyltransferase YhbS
LQEYDEAVELIDLGPPTDAEWDDLVGNEQDPWGAASFALEWRPKDHYVALRDDDGKLLAATGLVVADVQFGEGNSMPVVGIGGVIVAEPHRGRGLGWQVVSAALVRAAGLGPELAMLFCRPGLAEFYRRHGFAEVSAPVVVDQPGGVVEMPPVTMWRPLKDGAKLPDGQVRVLGLPF